MVSSSIESIAKIVSSNREEPRSWGKDGVRRGGGGI